MLEKLLQKTNCLNRKLMQVRYHRAVFHTYTFLCFLQVLKAEISSLKRLLIDANTSLSLWSRANQAAEPNVQLQPMLRGSNVSFVNLPATTVSSVPALLC